MGNIKRKNAFANMRAYFLNSNTFVLVLYHHEISCKKHKYNQFNTSSNRICNHFLLINFTGYWTLQSPIIELFGLQKPQSIA